MGRFYLWKLAAAVLATAKFHSQEIHYQEVLLQEFHHQEFQQQKKVLVQCGVDVMVTYIGNSYISLFISFLEASLHQNLVINDIKYQVLGIFITGGFQYLFLEDQGAPLLCCGKVECFYFLS